MDWGIFIRTSDERSILTSGTGIMDALLKQARSLGVDMLEDTMLLDLVVQDGKITGAMDLSDWGRMLENNEPVELGPAFEYFDGGIVVNDRFETDVEGLYAAGECTIGPFGANRVFAAITEMLVHGADAGKNAGNYAKGVTVPEPGSKEFEPLQERAERPLKRRDGIRPGQIRRPIQEMAHTHLGPIRNQDELTNFLQILDEAKRDKIPNLSTVSDARVYNKEWIDALELENTVHLLEAAVKSALDRTESRGVHYREDYPDTDNDNWVKESIVKLEGSALEIHHRPAVTDTLTPPTGVTPYLEMMKKMMDAHSDTKGHH